MEVRYGGRLPEWRYRAMFRKEAARETGADGLEAEAERRLAEARLPWCFGEMDYPHWRRIPVSHDSDASVCYYAGDDPAAREAALNRLVLCGRCPVYERCHKVTMAKKAVSLAPAGARKKQDLLAALGRM